MSTDDSIDNMFGRIGEAKLRQIIHGFYKRVPADPVLGPMYPPDDMAGAEWRLYGFIAQRLGGPADYSAQRGHPRLRMRHIPFAIDTAARDHWIQLMDAAINDVDLNPKDAELLKHFLYSVAHQMQNRE